MSIETTPGAGPAATAPAPQRPTRHHEVLVVGGGTGGIAVAARLLRAARDLDVAILEPSEHHHYQPLWTLVGAGVVAKERTRRRERDVIPAGATWIQDSAAELLPEERVVVTEGGERIGYDQLVVAPGIQLDWDAVEGLAGSVGRDGIVSNYAYEQAERTWEAIRSFGGGTAIFTMPATPVKCAGAPQKIAYLADDHFRRAGVRDRSRIVYASATPGIFAVEQFAKTLRGVVARKGIETLFRHDLRALRPDRREAVFANLDTGEEITLEYDLIHVTPPQSAPDFVKRSPLANEAGWLEVDRHTLRHPRHPEVFALGDASSLPTSRTGAAIRKQAPVLVQNLLALRAGAGADELAAYDGYAACPLVTGYGKLVLAEFDYDLRPAPSFPFDTTKERRSMYELKRRVLPAWYWRRMLRGR